MVKINRVEQEVAMINGAFRNARILLDQTDMQLVDRINVIGGRLGPSAKSVILNARMDLGFEPEPVRTSSVYKALLYYPRDDRLALFIEAIQKPLSEQELVALGVDSETGKDFLFDANLDVSVLNFRNLGVYKGRLGVWSVGRDGCDVVDTVFTQLERVYG